MKWPMNHLERVGRLCCALVVIACCTRPIYAQISGGMMLVRDPLEKSTTAEVDAEWKRVTDPLLDSPRSTTDVEKLAFITTIEGKRLAMRRQGLEFWKKYPADTRRWIWLLNTTWGPPRYFRDIFEASRMIQHDSLGWIPIDTAKAKEWKRQYATLKKEFMGSPQVTSENRGTLLLNESYSMFDELHGSVERGEKVDFQPYYDLTLKALKLNGSSVMIVASKYLNDWRVRRQANRKSERVFLAALNKIGSQSKDNPQASDGTLKTVIEARERLDTMRVLPDLPFVTYDGQRAKLSDYRGKVLLVDLWNKSCSSCISEFPKLRELYDRYRDKGFEIVGVVADDKEAWTENRQLALDHALPWKNLYTSEIEGVRRLLGVLGIPHTILLDRRGRPIVSTEGNALVELEAEIKAAIR